jgi:hypothetical protein
MAGYSARQSSYSDGDTITAAHTNDEFNQILAAFNVSTGHTHDGSTAGDGGPISKLFSNAITFGTGADTDIAITFDGNTSDGVLTWMEDEDYFQFSDDILLSTTEKLQFRDTAIYIHSSADGQLDLIADTEIQIAATTVDINGNVDVSGTLTVAGAVDFGDAALSNVGAVQLDSIAGDGDTDTSITFSGSDVITIAAGGANQVTFTNGAIVPSTDNDIDLGTSSVEFKDAFFDGTVTSDAFVGPLTGDVTGNVSGTAATVTGAAQSNITSLGTLTTLTVDDITINGSTISDGGDFTLDVNGDITLDANGGDILFKDDGTTFGSATNTSGNLIIKSGTTTALTFSGANVTVAGDLTISGDDLVMGTNTAGHILVADGTNFNPVAVGDLSEISTVANDDVFLAVDTSGGGLKKIARSAIVSGLASSAAISNVVEDTTPQLGGNLDMNGQDIITTSNADLELAPNGTGHVTVKGNDNPGTIQFNCEQNSHGVQLKGPAHSAGSSAVLTLPTATGTLIGTGDSGTVTNGMLAGSIADSKLSTISTAGKVELGALEIDGASEMGAALADADLLIVDDGAGGTEKSMLASRIPTYVFSKVSGDATVASNGALTIANDAVEQAMIADDAVGADQLAANAVVNASIASSAAIADSKLATISTAGKVALTALEIDGGTDIGADLVDADEIIVDDGGGGTNRRSDLERVKKYIYSAMSGDATASDAGAVTVANDAIESGMLNDNIISGQTALTSGLATTDELLISDGGTLKKMDVSVLSEQFASADDATALAIALG